MLHAFVHNTCQQQINPRWNFPSLYYVKTFSWSDGHNGTVTMDIIFIDTVST